MLLRSWYGHKAVDLDVQCQYLGLEGTHPPVGYGKATGCKQISSREKQEVRRDATYLVGPGGGRSRSLGKYVMAWRDGRAGLSVPSPIWPWLCVDILVPVPMSHVLRVLTVRALWWVRVLRRARSCYARVYGYIIVRFDLLVVWLGILMVASILQRHGRTCGCLRHTGATDT